MPVCAGGGGAQFSPNTSHMIWKRMVNTTLAMGHQAYPVHCYYKFHILQLNCSTQYFTILFWDWGRRQIARINSRRYMSSFLADEQAVTWDMEQPLQMTT
jgi:hypothetical protein